ncbi:MAG: hypothetical protein A2359_03965 [Candidatus Moranbacteria bacterium RIFOXYB1_FULL_43_19]|nr:MAG: hypothetical protein A2359_03965 [Candidatus Moranbacteria bacterium RIFOXYB1_FULL_43_19]OGI34020.1 MAG: hypothetical protein A2420_02655 [Candidatus Moranbacteria bacterium RIFOXYC1_FULL_44_13]OGI37732.1 MAG: hypothetical protein A2612_03150 [Candidatus Moranbacteria bacterium RIFOXYD1_FULL_44_12]
MAVSVNYFKDKVKYFLKRFFLIDDTPHKIAAGAALGIFLGVVPGMGFLATLVISSILRFNRLAALAVAGVMNIWTNFLFFAPAAFIGGAIFGVDYQDMKTCFEDTYRLGIKSFFTKSVFFDLTLPLACGYFLAAGIAALAAYFLLLFFLNFKGNRKNIHLLHKEDLGD